MESDELLSAEVRAGGDVSSRHEPSQFLSRNPTAPLNRQTQIQPYDATWSHSEVAAAISRELLEKAQRWKRLADESVPGPQQGKEGKPCKDIRLPEIKPHLSPDLNKHEVAGFYVREALAGRWNTSCVHDRRTFNALKVVRNKAWNQLLNVCTLMHLALPVLEVQQCLPCMGPQKALLMTDSLSEGWRPTILGSMWIECLLCLLYIYDLYLVGLSSHGSSYMHAHAEPRQNRGRCKQDSWRRRCTFNLPSWQLARTCMVILLSAGLLTNIFAHYVFHVTWHRWSRVTLPFLFISRRTYLKHFMGGLIRILPRMGPVVLLMSLVMFFYAFLGFILYRDETPESLFLGGLNLFREPTSSFLTFLRIFMSIPFMLDVEELYDDRKGIEVMGLSYGVIMVIFLGALIPAVANRNFQNQARESYIWVTEQRKLALTRAYHLVKGPDGTVARDDWVQLMSFLRPDCSTEHTSALFEEARKAESRPHGLFGSGDERRVSKGGFFMLCALGKADMSKQVADRSRRGRGWWGVMRSHVHAAFRWSPFGPRFQRFPMSRLIHLVAILIQGYQIVREGDAPEQRPPWAYALGRMLIIYFCINSGLAMIMEGCLRYLSLWNHVLGMLLNLFGVMYYLGLWPHGNAWRSLYHILQASRLMVLWSVLHLLGPTSSEVAGRLELMFPAVLRASFVLFSVIYSYAVVAYSIYCATPLGVAPIDTVAQQPMVQRYALYKHVLSFESLYESFVSMTDIVMLSNWPIFMDAAGSVSNHTFALAFFYSFKGLTFYFVMPVMLGFIVQRYMGASFVAKDQNAIVPSSVGKSDSPPRDTFGGSVHSTASLQDGTKKRSPEEAARGFSTFAVGPKDDVDVGHDQVSDGGSSDVEEEGKPVMIRSHRPSLSQSFWGAEQAKEVVEDSVSGEVDRLEKENSRLRVLLDNVQMELLMANARLYDEMQNQAHASSPKWSSRRANGNERPGVKFSSPEGTSARKRLGSANSIGMEAIVESDEEFDRTV